jgi:branched-chain amino acid transport system ATP-binding protein
MTCTALVNVPVVSAGTLFRIKVAVLQGRRLRSAALISRLSLVLLDEPSAGLAPDMARSIQLAVSRLCDGGLTVLVAEQNREWLQAVAQSALVLERGRLVNETDL